MIRHLGLFEGIGGFSLAASWMGWKTVAWVEINPDCQKVLKDKFSEAEGNDDIFKFNALKYAGTIDILTGGFPCQTFSLAGKGAMDLSLWKEMLRVISESKPRVVVAENVYGLLARKKGHALEIVCSDLEAQGYTVLPPLIIPACSVGAPHRRDRIWIIAYSNSNGAIGQSGYDRCQAQKSVVKENKWEWIRSESFGTIKPWCPTDTKAQRLPVRYAKPIRYRAHSAIKRHSGIPSWENFPTQSPISARNDGLPGRLDRSDARFRTKSIKGGGNAIVPQVAFEIFKAIDKSFFIGRFS